MGSDLYLNVETRSGPSRSEEHWGALFDGPSCALARGPVVDAFGTSDQLGWVRRIEGAEFVAIVREKRWQQSDWQNLECSADLRAFAALVESLLNDGLQVRVWCWNS